MRQCHLQDIFETINWRQVQYEDSILTLPEHWVEDGAVLAAARLLHSGVAAITNQVNEADVPEWLWRHVPDHQRLAELPHGLRVRDEADIRDMIRRCAYGLAYNGWRQGRFGDEDRAIRFVQSIGRALVMRHLVLSPTILSSLGVDWAYGKSDETQAVDTQALYPPVDICDTRFMHWMKAQTLWPQSPDAEIVLSVEALPQLASLCAQIELETAAQLTGQRRLRHHQAQLFSALQQDDTKDIARNMPLRQAVMKAQAEGLPQFILPHLQERAESRSGIFDALVEGDDITPFYESAIGRMPSVCLVIQRGDEIDEEALKACLQSGMVITLSLQAPQAQVVRGYLALPFFYRDQGLFPQQDAQAEAAETYKTAQRALSILAAAQGQGLLFQRESIATEIIICGQQEYQWLSNTPYNGPELTAISLPSQVSALLAVCGQGLGKMDIASMARSDTPWLLEAAISDKQALKKAKGRLSLAGAPFLSHEDLLAAGMSGETIAAVESALPEYNDLRYIFESWRIPEAERIEISPQMYDAANQYVYGDASDVLNALPLSGMQLSGALYGAFELDGYDIKEVLSAVASGSLRRITLLKSERNLRSRLLSEHAWTPVIPSAPKKRPLAPKASEKKIINVAEKHNQKRKHG